MDLSLGITEETEKIKMDTVDAFLSVKDGPIELLKLHFLFVHRLTSIFEAITLGTKEALSHIQTQITQLSTVLTDLVRSMLLILSIDIQIQ